MRNEPVGKLIDIGDARLNVWEWAGGGDPVVFLHATGFHGRCWDYIAKQLPDQHIYAVDLRFHGLSSKEGDVTWPIIAEDIKKLIQTLDLQKTILVGHSIGGYLATVVAAGLPERVKELLLLDPVIMSLQQYEMVEQVNGFMKPENHPVARRRTEWNSPDEMYGRFKDRSPFNFWQDIVLKDYCNYALSDADENGVRHLLCSPLDEVKIYLRHNGGYIHTAVPKVEAQATIIRAKEPTEADDPFSMTISPTWPQLAHAFKKGRDVYREDLTHFIPMEAPDLVVEHIKKALESSCRLISKEY